MEKKRVKEHNSHVTSAIYKHSICNNDPLVNISYLKIMTKTANKLQEKPSLLESQTLPSTVRQEICTPQKFSTTCLEHTDLLMSLTKWKILTSHKVTSSNHFKQHVLQTSVFSKLSSLSINTPCINIPCHQ